jgi:hypothetical protein
MRTGECDRRRTAQRHPARHDHMQWYPADELRHASLGRVPRENTLTLEPRENPSRHTVADTDTGGRSTCGAFSWTERRIAAAACLLTRG